MLERNFYSNQEMTEITGRYRNVQISMFWLGVFILSSQIGLGIFSNEGFPRSISHSYHTPMGDFAFGCLFAVGVFLISYQSPTSDASKFRLPVLVGTMELPVGYNFWISTSAGLGAIGVALLPVDPVVAPVCVSQIDQTEFTNCTNGLTQHGELLSIKNGWHFLSASVFFVGTALLCFFIFPAEYFRWSDPNNEEEKENIAYLKPAALKYFILGFILLICIYCLWQTKESSTALKISQTNIQWFFLWEMAAVTAFTVAWGFKAREPLT